MKIIIFGLLAFFFGIYALVLELKGISNFDQITIAVLFGVLAFLSR
ncbi:MAG: hypothetical protein LBK83_07835 [Treponema sp.]|jgi:hypothetical protein|nr:hypothetical protein [Treponema sp.]